MPPLSKRFFTFTVLAAGAGILMTMPALAVGQAHTQWSDYGGGPDAAQYTALEQITRGNVGDLKVAWTVPTGDGAAYSFQPVQARGVLYLMTAGHSITA